MSLEITTIKTPSWADSGPRTNRPWFHVQVCDKRFNHSIFRIRTYCKAAAMMAVMQHLNTKVSSKCMICIQTDHVETDPITGLMHGQLSPAKREEQRKQIARDIAESPTSFTVYRNNNT